MPKSRTDAPAPAGLTAMPQDAPGTRRAAFDPASLKATARRQGQTSGPARWAIPGKFGQR